MRRRLGTLATLTMLSIAVGIRTLAAAEYTFSLPVLGSPSGEVNLAVDLGGEFASISGALLRISGTHTPGLLGDLNSDRTFPYPASIDAYSPVQPFGHSGILGELLPSVVGPFDVDEPFRRINPGGPPNFEAWLDGTANFYFSAGPSAYLAIYRTIANPVVNISSATLVVTGERLDATVAPSADFDGDGTVDGVDLGVWQAEFHTENTLNYSGDDFLDWQRQLGPSNLNAAASVVPEPGAFAILLGGFLAMGHWRRQRAIPARG